MIVTLTANPSIDVTLTVDALLAGEVNRASDVRRDPAGKGVNVARALTQNGVAATALLPADAVHGFELERMLRDRGIASVSIEIAQPIRTNITVIDAHGTTTKLNEPGPRLGASEVECLRDLVAQQLAKRPAWLVCSGSLPPGVPDSFYTELSAVAASHGVAVALDASGHALAHTARAGVASLIKPNLEELEELLARTLRTVGDVVDGARELLRMPGAAALVSLGADGALLVTADDHWWAGAPAVVPVSTVGAGDSTLAGYLSVASTDPVERLTAAVAWGTAAVQLPGSQAPSPRDIRTQDVRVIARPTPTTPLGEIAYVDAHRP